MYKVVLTTIVILLSSVNGQYDYDGTQPMNAMTGMGGFTGSAPGLPYQTGTAGVIAPTGFMSPIASGNPYNVINTRPSLPQVPNFVGPSYQERTSPSDQLVAAIQWVAQASGYPTAVFILSRLPILGKALLLPVTWFFGFTNWIRSLWRAPVQILKSLIFGL